MDKHSDCTALPWKNHPWKSPFETAGSLHVLGTKDSRPELCVHRGLQSGEQVPLQDRTKGTNYWPTSTTRNEKPRAQQQQRQTQGAEPAADRRTRSRQEKARFCHRSLGQQTLSLQTQSQHHQSGFNSCPAFLNMVSVDHGGHSEERGYVTWSLEYFRF